MKEIKVATINDLDEILSFERAKIDMGDFEQEMKSWSAPWRKEALEHYLPQGWSFVIREGKELSGYILCQPFLFFHGWTQSLWVEHVSAKNEDVGRELLELAYKWSRDKHLQKVILTNETPYFSSIDFAAVHTMENFHFLSTTKGG